MIRVDPKYTLYQFENDMKSVLKKSAFQAKKNKEENTAEKNDGAINNSNAINNDD